MLSVLGMVRIVPALLWSNCCQGQNNSYMAVIYFWLRKSKCYKSFQMEFSGGVRVGGGVDFRVFLLNQFPCLHNSSNLLSAMINQHKGQKLTEKEQPTKPRKEKAERKVTLTQVFSLECWVHLGHHA